MESQIEIKINIVDEIGDALPALGDPRAQMSRRQIWFAEDPRGVAAGRLPLLDGGVIVRFRSGDGPDDVTAKLRPCDESLLVGRWTDEFKTDIDDAHNGRVKLKYRIEGDWSGPRRVLAASLVSSRTQGSLLEAVTAGDDAARVLDGIQRQFLDTCAQPPLQVDQLVALGPIASTKWTDLRLGKLDIDMERWQVVDLDFLELSIRVEPKVGETADKFTARATRKQQELTTSVRECGLAVADDVSNKTQRVLTALAAAAHC